MSVRLSVRHVRYCDVNEKQKHVSSYSACAKGPMTTVQPVYIAASNFRGVAV